MSSPANLEAIALDELNADPALNIRVESVADEDLVASVRAQGILEPVLVRASDKRLVLGFRRYDAARQAGLEAIPAILGEWTDAQVLELQLIENLQRQDLAPMEEARAIRAYLETDGHTQKGLAKAIGKSRPWVANRLRLLKLPDRAQRYVEEGLVSAKVADRLLTLKTPELRESFADELAERAKDRGSPVPADRLEHGLRQARQVEDFLRKAKVTTCPTCGHLMTPLNTETWDIGGWKGDDALRCGSCRAQWNAQTGEVLVESRQVLDGDWEEKDTARKAAELKRKKKEREALLKAQKLPPYHRSGHSPLEWLAGLGLKEEDVLRVDLDHKQSWSSEGPAFLRIHLRPDFKLPFRGRIRSVPYTDGRKAQVLLGQSAPRDDYYISERDARKLKALQKGARAMEKTLGDVDAGELVDPDVSVLEKSVPDLIRSIAASKKGRPKELPLIEWLERLREAEVAGKNRKGAVEAIDAGIKRIGDEVKA